METIFSQVKYLLDINTTFFTALDYQMSYVEFFGTIFTVWCVWLTAKAKVLSWPVGIIGTLLYIFLFYQISLYSDLFEQIYFLITGFIGWWFWLRPKAKESPDSSGKLKIGMNTPKVNMLYLLLVATGTALFAYVAIHLDVWFPEYFKEPASLPILDAFTTSMSFVAQWLLARKKVESWVLWILVDIIGIWLYWVKGVKFISLEYVLFLGIAIKGFIGWKKEFNSYNKNAKLQV